ncbi:DUF2157 domain-containing protein [Bacillus massiliigorillae]|uniref:DUF2157 domain-containing protein n=1 Tax=Bacillus massiliigorillae TaxID=1243664 RepID=UPI0003AB0D24|nr:DUF2157 domain-containing protein [Bacillus massiliigorillae]
MQYLKDQHATIEMDSLEQYYVVENQQKQVSWHTFLWIGAVLVGIGFLTFIASNWSALSALVKYLFIFFGVIGFYVAGRGTENSLPRTARSFYYLGGFLFGAGIFLVGQTFHLGGAVYTAFLFWAVGIIPLAYYLKDRVVLGLAIIFLLFYSLQIYGQGELPLALLVIVPLIYYINHTTMYKSSALFFLNSILLTHFLHSALWHFGVNQFVIVLLLFVLGIIICWRAFAAYKEAMSTFGYILHGVYGIVLTMPSVWEYVFSPAVSQILAIIFAIIYGLSIILLIRKGILLPIVILCGLITRFYIDISYDFLPKSLFFILGGALLIIFGIWFERSRRGETKA